MCDWRVAIETGSSLVVMRNRGLRLGCYSWYGNVPFRNVSALKGPQNVASGQRPTGTGPSAPAPTRRLTGCRPSASGLRPVRGGRFPRLLIRPAAQSTPSLTVSRLERKGPSGGGPWALQSARLCISCGDDGLESPRQRVVFF